MGLADLDTLIAEYHLDAAGWDAGNTRFTDQSGYGNHLVAINGTPDLTTINSLTCAKMQNDWWCEAMDAMLPIGSIAAVCTANNTGADGIMHLYNSVFNPAGSTAGNFEGAYSATDADYLISGNQRRFMTCYTELYKVGDKIGVAAGWTTAHTPDDWQLVVGSFPGEPNDVKIDRNLTEQLTTTFGTGTRACQSAFRMRVGHLHNSGTTTGYAAMKRLYFFKGDVMAHASYATEAAAEKTLWGIT